MSSKDHPLPLYCLSWMAMRCDDFPKVVEKLRLCNPRPCDWKSAQELTQKYGQTVFVSPSVDGWVFVAGALPMEAARPSSEDPFLAWMRELSIEFGDVRHFSEDNSCPWATWSWCKNGEVMPAYAFRTDPKCEVLWNVGQTTDAERDAGYKYGDSGFEGVVPHEEYQDWLPYEEATEEISSAWGVSITELNEEMPCQCSEGVQGTMQVPWAEDGELEVEETLPGPTPEEEQMALEEKEETVRKYDMVHFLQLYCQSRNIPSRFAQAAKRSSAYRISISLNSPPRKKRISFSVTFSIPSMSEQTSDSAPASRKGSSENRLSPSKYFALPNKWKPNFSR